MRLTRSGQRSSVEETDEVSILCSVGLHDSMSDFEIGCDESRSLRSERSIRTKVRDRHEVFCMRQRVSLADKSVSGVNKSSPRMRAYMLWTRA